MHIIFAGSMFPGKHKKTSVARSSFLVKKKQKYKLIPKKRWLSFSYLSVYSSTWIVVSFTDSTPFWDMSRSAKVLISEPSPCTRITSRQRSWVTCE